MGREWEGLVGRVEQVHVSTVPGRIAASDMGASLYGLEDADVQSAGVLYLDVLQQLARAVELRHLRTGATGSHTLSSNRRSSARAELNHITFSHGLKAARACVDNLHAVLQL